MARAIRWVPGDAVYRARWSLMAADPTAAVSALEKAVALNPYYSWAWIQLGLAAEAAGDPHRAESLLTRAAAVDRRFKPAWALCDYYYRHPSANRFWYWSRQALVMSEADSRPVFRLAWHMEPDAATILARALPPTARARRDFLAWLLAEPLAGRRCAGPGGYPASCAGAPSAEAAMPAIRAVLTSAGPGDTPLLLTAIDKLLDSGAAAPAVDVWNELCRRRALPFQPISAAGHALTNAAFSTAPAGRGFDWHWNPPRGVNLVDDGEPGRLKIQFSGEQPEQCRLLTQKIPVLARRRYTFQSGVRIPGEPPSGLRWKIFEGNSDRPLAEAEATASQMNFTNIDQPVVTLVLDYARPRGSSRLTGVVSVGGLDLYAAGAQ